MPERRTRFFMTELAHSSGRSFKELFEQKYKDMEIKEGSILEGKIAAIRRDVVVVDVGLKSEGLINAEEFKNFDGEIAAKVGDTVRVMVEQLEDNEGNLVLSKEKADALESWDRVVSVYEKEELIEGVVFNKIKGGMSVNLGGIKAFLPASQIDVKPVKSLDKLIGQRCQFKILKLNQAKGNIVLSRRAVLEVERENQRQELLANLKEGQVVTGMVKNITDYGAFIDLGGLDGLLHITDMTWGRINHPGDVLQVGKEIEVTVLKYDQPNAKVSLGLKQLSEDPWSEVEDKFQVADQLRGRVVNVADYGVFVELAPGIEGLVHVSELTWSKKVKHPSKIVKVGDEVEAVILDIDANNRRISLGVKQLEPNPWYVLEEKFPAGTHIKGVVRNVTDFGIFVGIEDQDIDGLVHVSDMSWENVKTPAELYKKGDEVEAVVLSIDKENERFSLGMKQLIDDPWSEIRKKYGVGNVIHGKVVDIQLKSITLSVTEDLEATIAAADLSLHDKINPKERFKLGEEVTAMVKKLDEKAKTIVASIKNYEKSLEKQNMKEFLTKQGSSSVKLEDTLNK